MGWDLARQSTWLSGRSCYRSAMNWLVLCGSGAFGMVIGWMVQRTFTAQRRPDVKSLGLIVSVMAGSSIIGIFGAFSKGAAGQQKEVWAYPIGLLFAISFMGLLDFATHNEAKDIQRRRARMEEASEVIAYQLRREPGKILSFEELRTALGPSIWSDGFLRSVIRAYPSRLSHVTLEGGVSGIALAEGS